MTDNLDLFKRNGLISKDGKVAVVLAPPLRPAALQAELGPLIAEAQRKHVMVRLGITRFAQDEILDTPSEVLVFAIDLGGPHDDHRFLRRLETILTRHGVQPLDYDVDSDQVFKLASDLIGVYQT